MSVLDNDTRLIEILTEIKVKLSNLENIYTGHLKEHSDHETRIRSLEKRVWSIPSASLIVSIIGVVVAYFVH